MVCTGCSQRTQNGSNQFQVTWCHMKSNQQFMLPFLWQIAKMSTILSSSHKEADSISTRTWDGQWNVIKVTMYQFWSLAPLHSLLRTVALPYDQDQRWPTRAWETHVQSLSLVPVNSPTSEIVLSSLPIKGLEKKTVFYPSLSEWQKILKIRSASMVQSMVWVWDSFLRHLKEFR